MVRSDLSPSQQAVQACHACLESGKQHPWRGEHPHLVLLSVPHEDSLNAWLAHVQRKGLTAVPFREPDLGNSLTAFAVPGVHAPEDRQLFAGVPVLKLGTTITKEKVMNKHESKWGFHPCSREIFLQLRRINFLALQARRRIAAHTRWGRKDPQNRRLFVGGAAGYEGAKKRQIPKSHRVYRVWEEPVLPPIDVEMADIIAADYQNARIPVPEKDVRKLILSDGRLLGLLKSLEDWYAAVPAAVSVS